jgi:hypothetical protein
MAIKDNCFKNAWGQKVCKKDKSELTDKEVKDVEKELSKETGKECKCSCY